VTGLDHNPDDPDDVPGFTTPNKPSELTALGDEEMFRLLRKVAFANQWPISSKVQFEAMARFMVALNAFKAESERTGQRLVALTIALVVLTIILIGLTVAIVWLTTELE
jgi:hypothetical protein